MRSSAARWRLLLSIWGKKTHEVLLASYAFGILWLLSGADLGGPGLDAAGGGRPGLAAELHALPYNPCSS
ncbi:MAG: hypothetical protein U0790_11720 [Isosphaeraceae bacterium]